MKIRFLLGVLAFSLCLIAGVKAQAGWTEPVPVQELNMSGDELTPYLSADGQIMIFSAQGTVTMSHWNGTSWGPREYLPSPINYEGLQRQAAITPDLHWIYWVSWRAGGIGMWDIWRAGWDDSSHTCGPAECLGPNVNSADIEWSICFTADGQRMYFVTDTHFKNGQYNIGSMDIWYVDWDSTIGDWGEPFNLGPPVNTTDMEEYPNISADGNTLYFCCPGGHQVPGWQGGFDIYKAVRVGNDWGNIENLLPPINSPLWDWGPSITPDGLKLYFCAHRNRDPNADYELMVSTWEPSAIEDDNNTEYIGNTISLDSYPNPFNNETNIELCVTDNITHVSLLIYETSGRLISNLYDGPLDAGIHNFMWNGKGDNNQPLASGIYFCKLKAGTSEQTRKLILLR